MCRAWVRQGKRVWFIAHRQEILAQAARVFDEAGVAHGPGRRVEFKMIAAAAKAVKSEPAPDVLIFDECHHAPAKTWAGVIAAAPKARRLGLTATPGRLDGAPLSEFFAELVQGPSPKELREAGHLARYRYFAPVVPDLSGVKVRKGEYDRSQAVEIMTGAAIVGDVVEHYLRHAAGRRAILFAVSTEASRDMAARFNKAGIPALHVDAQTPDDERAAAISAVRQGKVKVLCNCELFTEGFDLPSLDAVILLRPTRSLALFRQMLGRGARPSGRRKTVILDHAACVVEHGLPDEEYQWTLSGERPRRKREIEGGQRTRMRRCPECSAVHEWADTCPECGHTYSGSREPTEVDGRLGKVEKPQGSVSYAEYARICGVTVTTVRYRVRKGLPRNGRFIDLHRAEEWLSRQRAAHRARITEPERRKALLEGHKKWQVSADAQERLARATKTLRSSENRAKASAKMREIAANPEYRAAASARARAQMNTPEGRDMARRASKLGVEARWGKRKGEPKSPKSECSR